MPWVGVLAAGAIVGVLLGLLLRTGIHRRDAERQRPAPPAIAVAAPAAMLAVSWALIALATPDPIQLGAHLAFASFAAAAGWIDLDVHRIPNPVVAGQLAVSAGGLCAAAAAAGEWDRFGRAALVAGTVLIGLLLLTVVTSLGPGDAKLAAPAALVLAWAGWPAVTLGFLATATVAGLAAAGLLIAGRPRSAHMPLGPSIALGSVVALVAT